MPYWCGTAEKKFKEVLFALVKEYKSYNLVQPNMQQKNTHHIEIIININLMNFAIFIVWAAIYLMKDLHLLESISKIVNDPFGFPQHDKFHSKLTTILTTKQKTLYSKVQN